MRIFIGLSEIANVNHNYARGFQSHGVSTFTVVTERAWAYPDSTYDVVIDEDLGRVDTRTGWWPWCRRLGWRVRYYSLLLKAAATCDVCIFIFGSGFRADRRDYALLKRLGKRIVSVFLGDDTRYWYAYTQEAERNGTAPEIRTYLDEVLKDRQHDYLGAKLMVVRSAERYSDLILSLPEMGQLQTRPYMRVDIPIDMSALQFAVHDREVPVIVHAPSVRGIKGTDHVLAAVEQLRAEGLQFEFKLIERQPNAFVRSVLTDSDILVDQLYSETVATLALEGLATGNAVLARYLPERSRISADCPVINVNSSTLVERLREVIVDRGLRRTHALAGRAYVEANHSKEAVTARILKWLEPGSIQEYDFYPTFLRDEFCMPQALLDREATLLAEEPAHMRFVDLEGVRVCDE